MLQVRDRMSDQIEIAQYEMTALEVAKIMAEKKIGSLLVRKGADIIGIITETDLVRKVLAKDNVIAYKALCETVMSHPLKTIAPDRSVHEATEIMDKHGVRHLAVEEHGEVVGVISVRDLIHPEYLDGEGW